MKNNIFIKHNKYIDVCCLVLKHFNTGTKRKIKIQWWNLGYVNSHNMGYMQNIIINNDDLQNWLWTNDNVNCLRNANWREFK